MFVVSKLFWMIAAPGNFLLLTLCLGVALVLFRKRRAGRWLMGLAVSGLLAAATLPFGVWLITPLENRFPVVADLPAKIDGIVTLGGTVNQFLTLARGQPAISNGAERLTSFISLANRYPRAKLVFTGGSASLSHPEIKETLVARQLFSELGLDPSRVMFEDRSRNTSENAILTYALVRPKPEETWLLITSAMHMPRSVGVFRRAGWRIMPYPVDFQTDGSMRFRIGFNLGAGLRRLNAGIHEWLGLAAYRILGRTDHLFPGPEI